MDSELETKETTYTRTKVLKRAGVGAAALWGVGMFATTEGAFAAGVSGKVCVQLALNGSTAGGIGPCDYGDSPARPCPCHVGGFVGPVCDPQGSGRCFCFAQVGTGCPACVDAGNIGNPCASKRDCPKGWKCVYTCLDACPGGVGCCDNCTGNSQPAGGTSGSGLVCLQVCSKTGGASASAIAAARKVASTRG
jgi:hypothetical protein